jgi:hypothetical protein
VTAFNPANSHKLDVLFRVAKVMLLPPGASDR